MIKPPDMTASSEPPLSRRTVQKSLRLSILASCVGMVWFAAAAGMPLTMLLEALGASGLLLGLAMTAQQLAMGFQLAGGLIANRLQRRKAVWFAFALPHRLLWFLLAALPFLFSDTTTAAQAVVATVAVSAALGNMATPAWFSWMSDLVPARENGRFWSLRQVFTTAAFLVATGIVGYMLDVGAAGEGSARLKDFAFVFAITAVFGTGDILLHMRVPSATQPDAPAGRPLAAILNILRDRNFRMLTLAFGIWGLSLGLMGPFAPVYLKRVFNASYFHLAALTITFSLGAIIAGFFWGRVMDTIGARSFGSIMLLSIPLFAIPWFLMSQRVYTLPLLGATPEVVLVYIIINFFSGAFFSGVALCQLNLITTLATQESRTIAQALFFTITGTLAALGPLLGGRIMDWMTEAPVPFSLPRGIAFSFYHAQLVLHMVTAAAAAWMFHKTTPAVTDVPVRQLLGNPLRTLTIIQNLITIATPRNEKERARAIEKLSFSRVDAALETLERALTDPSPLVRAAALRALGRLHSGRSVELLETYYHESGDTGLFPALAAALADAARETSVPTLIELLNENESVQIEAVRALGIIGSEWTRHPLINLLQRSQNPAVIEAIGNALSRIAARQLSERKRQVDYAEKLARTHTDVAIETLIGSLNDPSADVRSATLAALTKIRNPAAIHALLHQLQKADRPARTGIAKALVASQSPDGLKALIDNLGDGDPDSQFESARSLGEIGDRRASHALLELLRTSEDARVIAASSEALVHLREIAAFYDIIPRMKTTSNPLLKRTLAVAAGNLLGKAGSFYSFLIQEENLPGSQTARRLDQLARRISRLCLRRFKEAEAPLTATLNALEHAIETARWPTAAERLFELSVGLAALTYGLTHNDEKDVFIEQLLWHDEHVGVCTWFLYMITHDWNNPTFGAPTQLDALLGLYFLSEWEPRTDSARKESKTS